LLKPAKLIKNVLADGMGDTLVEVCELLNFFACVGPSPAVIAAITQRDAVITAV
jgi:hypothetical protein